MADELWTQLPEKTGPDGTFPVLHHVGMITNDLDATEHFYCEILNGKVIQRGEPGIRGWTRQCFIQIAPNALLEFFEYPETEPPGWTSMFIGEVPTRDRLLEHIAFIVDEDEWDDWRERLTAAGVEVSLNDSPKAMFFADPNNAVIQVLSGNPLAR